MREILFRAHNKKFKITEYVDTIDFGSECVLVKLNGVLTNWHFDDVDFMQYTGLKDKNGDMVFEGDKIKHPYSFLKDSYFIVKYDENKASFIFESARHNDKTVSEICLITQFEVIGNIYDKEQK